RPFMADNRPVVDLDNGRKQMVPTGASAGFEEFRLHTHSISQSRPGAKGFQSPFGLIPGGGRAIVLAALPWNISRIGSFT
ncbi:MAG TPA: hypothetical protein VL970_08615, partial [Candidatus Acidoferrales bacterium]|nr:hypothetical protein [Candidatus Acidoferrales bacterium]